MTDPILPGPPERGPLTAVIAPTAEDALALVREHRLPPRTWFLVVDEHSVFSRFEPGHILTRTVVGAPLSSAQTRAREWLLLHGWREGAT